MNKEDERQTPQHDKRSEDAAQVSGTEKKPFVEPTISASVNVFDATTFFLQGTDIGGDG